MKKKVVVVGDITLDLVSSVLKSLPEEDTETSTEFTPKVGGQAAHCALGLAHLGINTYLYGCIGKDPRSELILHKLKKQQNLELHLQRKQKTALSVIAITKEKRTIFNDPGANALLEMVDLKTTADYLFVGGIWHLKKLDLHKLFKQAKAKQMTILVDFGWNTRPDFQKIKLVFDQADYVFLNQKELLAFTKQKTIPAAIKRLKPNLALHLGKLGSLSCCEGEITKAPASKLKISDTTGAGDYWNAAFIYGLSKDWPMKKTLTFANKFAIRQNLHLL
ncbi:MAG: carbohydrate kinase family protein [Candidatus Woesearchaeota archaeon]